MTCSTGSPAGCQVDREVAFGRRIRQGGTCTGPAMIEARHHGSQARQWSTLASSRTSSWEVRQSLRCLAYKSKGLSRAIDKQLQS